MMPGMIAEDDEASSLVPQPKLDVLIGRSNRSWRESMACVRR